MNAQFNSIPAYAWIEKGKDREIKSNTGRERININGLFSPDDFEIITREDNKIDSESTLKLLKEAEKRHPELDIIYVIRDNAKSILILKWIILYVKVYKRRFREFKNSNDIMAQ